MKQRSPALGYNHNVRHLGRLYHVQTEDSGVANPHLYTHLFFGGTILATKRSNYDPNASEDAVRSLMQSQHKAMLLDLRVGKFDAKLRAFFAQRGESAEVQGAGPLESDPEEAAPEPRREPDAEGAVAGAAAKGGSASAAGGDSAAPYAVVPREVSAAPTRPQPGGAFAPPDDEEGPLILLTPPPIRVPVGLAPIPAASSSMPPPAARFGSSPEPPVVFLAPPTPTPTPSPAPPPASRPSPPPPSVTPPRPVAAGSGAPRRIWAKKGGGTPERPFEDGAVLDSLPESPGRRQPNARLPPVGTAQIVDRPPGEPAKPMARPGLPADRAPPVSPYLSHPATARPGDSADDGPVVVLAAPPPSSARRSAPVAPAPPPTTTPQRGLEAVPTGRPSRPVSGRHPVNTATPTADGVVIARPAVVVSGAARITGPPRPPDPRPTPHPAAATMPFQSGGSSGPTRAVGAGSSVPAKTKATANPPREAPADSLFGEDLISEKSLDEVILAYLAEDAKHPKGG